MKLQIENMTCGGCARSVTKAIQSVDPTAVVKPDVARREVEVSTIRGEAEIRGALAEAGYPASAEERGAGR